MSVGSNTCRRDNKWNKARSVQHISWNIYVQWQRQWTFGPKNFVVWCDFGRRNKFLPQKFDRHLLEVYALWRNESAECHKMVLRFRKWLKLHTCWWSQWRSYGVKDGCESCKSWGADFLKVTQLIFEVADFLRMRKCEWFLTERCHFASLMEQMHQCVLGLCWKLMIF